MNGQLALKPHVECSGIYYVGSLDDRYSRRECKQKDIGKEQISIGSGADYSGVVKRRCPVRETVIHRLGIETKPGIRNH